MMQSLIFGWFVSFGGKAMTDQYSYLQFYNSIANTPLGLFKLFTDHIKSITSPRHTLELGYVFLNVLFSKIGFGYVGFIFIFSVAINYLLLKFIVGSKTIYFTIIIFITSSLFAQQANLVRQLMAVAIFAYSIKYLISRQLIKYLLIILLGSTIHMSALILIPFYFIVDRHFPKYFIILFWMISVLINLFGIELGWLKSFNFIYYDTTIQRINRPEELLFSYTINLLFIISVLLSQKKMFNEPFIRLSFNLYFIWVVLLNLTALGFLFYRISLYFSVFSIIIIPLIPQFYRENDFIKKIRLDKYSSFLLIPMFIFYVNILIRRIISSDVITLGTEFYSFTDFLR